MTKYVRLNNVGAAWIKSTREKPHALYIRKETNTTTRLVSIFYIPKTSSGLAGQFVGESTKLVWSMFI
ncbi:hypothetical protein VP96_03740 (plasmid) [Vibrio cholerae]|uniref:hypothetical protein n=1 Tax=Vibrio cholerae TaxID=666 RepID=UPI00063A2A4F|nr:hypothetical protein [Vibrio cholerae]KKP07902.1 hypothetical protein VP96_03740 [Vibrio cholerae]